MYQIFCFFDHQILLFCLMQGFRVFVFFVPYRPHIIAARLKTYPRDFTADWCFSPFSCLRKTTCFCCLLFGVARCRVPIPLTKRLHGPYQHKLNGNERTLQHSQTFCLVHACQSQCGVRKLVSGTMEATRVIITTVEKYLRRTAIV